VTCAALSLPLPWRLRPSRKPGFEVWKLSVRHLRSASKDGSDRSARFGSAGCSWDRSTCACSWSSPITLARQFCSGPKISNSLIKCRGRTNGSSSVKRGRLFLFGYRDARFAKLYNMSRRPRVCEIGQTTPRILAHNQNLARLPVRHTQVSWPQFAPELGPFLWDSSQFVPRRSAALGDRDALAAR
jgi:hypothetical protein